MVLYYHKQLGQPIHILFLKTEDAYYSINKCDNTEQCDYKLIKDEVLTNNYDKIKMILEGSVTSLLITKDGIIYTYKTD